MKLRVICSWCEQVIDAGDPGAPESHGICDTCSRLLDVELTELDKTTEGKP